MLIKIFTLRFSERIEGFDDEPVRAFMADKEIAAVGERFFIKDGVPYWTVMLKYKPASDAKTETPTTETARQGRKTDPRDILQDADMPLYNRLRDWRNERARKDGVPPYVVFNNKQVAEIASKRPRMLNQLSAVEGFGKNDQGPFRHSGSTRSRGFALKGLHMPDQGIALGNDPFPRIAALKGRYIS